MNFPISCVFLGREHAETEVLNAYGALLRMKPHLPIPIDVELSKLILRPGWLAL